jgi:hypothetical protein
LTHAPLRPDFALCGLQVSASWTLHPKAFSFSQIFNDWKHLGFRPVHPDTFTEDGLNFIPARFYWCFRLSFCPE